jgi:hypothetical protein
MSRTSDRYVKVVDRSTGRVIDKQIEVVNE